MKQFKNNLIFAALFVLIALLSSCQTAPSSDKKGSFFGLIKTKTKPVYEAQYEKLNIPYRSLNTSKVITSFGFGSCNHQKQEQPLWKVIQSRNPDLFVMMGDNVYASKAEDKPIVDQYMKLNENTDYKHLRETTPFLATWDDHDYGVDDSGASNPEKNEARKVFVNYWGYIKQTLPKNQQAIYHSRIVGEKKQKVQFIMLDTRWDRSEIIRNPEFNREDKTQPYPPKIFLPNNDKSTQILSAEQWKWLEQELNRPADLRILVSSFQVIADNHYFEKWGNFPHEREKFFNLLKRTKTKNLVILSGDRHLSAIAKYDNGKLGPLYEITSSGLNRPSRNTEPEIDPSYTGPSFLKINFGLATIDWNKRVVNFNIIDETNSAVLSQDVKF